jgi:hypothetical protein
LPPLDFPNTPATVALQNGALDSIRVNKIENLWGFELDASEAEKQI